jgi:hypothetical protein
MIFAKYLPHLYQGADHKGHRTYNMGGGGGGGGPTQSTVTQTSVPEWLRPQTEAVLGAGMQEYFDATPRRVTNPLTGETTTEYDITGTKPYTPYSQNAADYFAPFSQQQQQVFGETAGMRTPGGFQTGQQMTGMAGQGGLDTVGSAFGYGGQGAGFGQQAAGMGGMYERMATDPMSMQAYMSPYMQNVVEIQKQQAIEDAQRAQLGANLGAARQGTYGGARQTLAQTQREAALNKQLSDIQAQGLQSAFDQAQKSQQFGVTSGLQGLQTGIQGAGMGLQGVQGAQAGFGLLGRMGEQAANIGTAQQQADIARLGFQGQMGDIQQQRQQDIINQQIQNFALAQEMPFQRLAGYNALLRGYATPTSTVSQYQAAANPLQTIGALGTAAGGFGTLMGGGKKAGGAIKLAGGGGITDKDALESFAERASIPQLQQSMQSGELKGKEYIGAPILQNKIVNEERMKAAQAAMAGGQQQGSGSILDGLLANADQLQGITDIAEPAPVMAAGGGVVAFQAGGLSFSDVMRQATLQEQRDYQRTGVLSTRLQNLMAAQTMPQKGSDKADIEAVLAEAEAGRGPNVQRVSTDPKTQNKQLVAAPAPAPAPPTSATAGNETIAAMGDTIGFGLSPPELEFKPQGITSIVEPTRQEEVEQYLKERTGIMGEDEYLKALKDRAKKEPSIYDRLSSAGAQIGLAGSMLRDPGQFGAYAKQAAELQGAQRKSAEERELAFLAAQRAERETKGKAFDVVEGRRQEAAKAETERKFKSKEAELTRQAQITAANIAAGKPTDMRYYANMKLKAQNGDKEAQIRVGAIDNFLQQSALGRNIVAQQGVEVREKAIDVNLYNNAVEYTDSKIGRGGSRYNEYKQLQQKDKENAAKGNPTTLAEDLENTIRDTYIKKAQGQKQAQSGAAPQGAGGKESPLPMPKTAAEAVDGKVYMTAKGPARWSAKDKVFVPVQ